jgi:hypothetical protein
LDFLKLDPERADPGRGWSKRRCGLHAETCRLAFFLLAVIAIYRIQYWITAEIHR